MDGLRFECLHSVEIKAIQEQQKIIGELLKRISILEGRPSLETVSFYCSNNDLTRTDCDPNRLTNRCYYNDRNYARCGVSGQWQIV